LLSAIGDLSLGQSLALTGSVNQHGQVQAIGGVLWQCPLLAQACDRGTPVSVIFSQNFGQLCTGGGAWSLYRNP
jgi:hypothetical protein